MTTMQTNPNEAATMTITRMYILLVSVGSSILLVSVDSRMTAVIKKGQTTLNL